MTFKTDIYEICHEVASEFDGWSFTSSGDFKNKTLKHTDLIVTPSFFFKSLAPSCSVTPYSCVVNKRASKLCKKLVGWDWVLRISFQLESPQYRGASSVMHIFPEQIALVDPHGAPQPWPSTMIVQAQAKDYLRKMLADGIGFIKKYFDLSTEENFLRHLPTTYKWMDGEWPDGSFYEKQDGIMMCVAAIVLGNFDFVENYASDDFKTYFPKREIELQKIIGALPELKRKFAETGNVI